MLFTDRFLARLYPLERTLKAERQVCKLLPTLVPKEVGHAYYPCHSDASDCKVRPAVFQAGVGACADIGGRGAARAWHRTVTAVLRVMD